MEKTFDKNDFSKRLKSMLKVDFRRMFTMRFLYVMAGISLVMPILILVMTSMMGGTETDTEAAMESFTSVWQIIGSLSTASATSMDITSMCNINLIYFMAGIFVCVFIADDFRSGYAKNLFAVRAGKTDYVISKTLAGFAGGAIMLIAFLIGALLGGAIAGLSFTMDGVTVGNIIMCILSKIFLMMVFAAIYVVMCVIAKEKTWLSILLSLAVGMLLFMMISMITPLDATILNVILCLAGGIIFAVGLGAISRIILAKFDII